MFAINGNRLPSCHSYIGARAIWAKAPIINKDDPNVRALVSKHEKDKVVYLEGETVCFRYHRTVLVRWHSEDHVSFNHHDSVSSRTFIDRFTPTAVWSRSFCGATIINAVQPSVSYTHWHYSERLDEWVVDPATAKPFHQIKVDASIARRAAKAVRPVLDWVSGVTKLRGSSPAYQYQRPTIADVMDLKQAIETDTVRQHIAAIWNRFGSTNLAHMACLALGGVSVEPLPIGELPKKSVYDHLKHLISMYEPYKNDV